MLLQGTILVIDTLVVLFCCVLGFCFYVLTAVYSFLRQSWYIRPCGLCCSGDTTGHCPATYCRRGLCADYVFRALTPFFHLLSHCQTFFLHGTLFPPSVGLCIPAWVLHIFFLCFFSFCICVPLSFCFCKPLSRLSKL